MSRAPEDTDEDSSKTVDVTYQGAKAVVWRRGDGRWSVTWKGGNGTTRKRKVDALKKARQVVRDIAAGMGSRTVTIEESEIVQMVSRICGQRSPVAVLGELEDALKVLKGTPLRRCVSHWISSGMADVVRIGFKAARDRFLDGYGEHSGETYSTLKKELDAFLKTPQSGVDICDLDLEILKPWVTRRGLDGEKLASRTINNRLSVWVTFLNACRDWGYLAKGEKHVGELIPKLDEPSTMVPIWRPGVARSVLACVWRLRPNRVPFIVLGCWMAFRPSELGRLRWEMFDWKRNYVLADITVVMKVKDERYVPINPTARALLERWLRDKGWWTLAVSGKLTGKVGSARDSQGCSELVRKHRVIETWEVDVMRHSCISYQIAEGHPKAKIAEWSGNSESIIDSNYRHPLMAEDGKDFFDLAEIWKALKLPVATD